MCADNVSKGGRSPSSLSLPVANSGGSIKPTHINSLAAALEKFAIQPSKGIRLTRTPSGSTLRIDEKTRHHHPWFTYTRSGWLHIIMGRFFYDSPSAAGGAKGGRNGWMSNKSYAHASGYVYAAGTTAVPTDGEFSAGAEIFCDIVGSNYISTRGMNNGKIPLVTAIKSGLYYIEVSGWSGRQLIRSEAPFLTEAQGTEINKYSLAKKGSRVPVIKWASFEDARKITTLIYPICTVDNFKNIFQGVRSDIFHIGSEDQCPLSVSFASPQASNPTNQTQKFVKVAIGVINKAIPKIGNKYIDEPEVYLNVSNAPGFVYAKATYTPAGNLLSDKYFPSTVEIAFVSGDKLDADDDTKGHFPLARIRRTELDPGGPGDVPATYADDYTIAQITCGNLVVNRLKAGENTAVWWWDVL